MIIQKLKAKILNTNYFINNEYLDKYCGIIINNLNTKEVQYKTNKHHIVPKCYFKMLGLPVDNSSENLVHILYKDHIIAHYYLCLCTKNKLKRQLVNAFAHLINRKEKCLDFNPETDLEYYQEIYTYYKSKVHTLLYKPIICIETQEIFPSVKSAKEKYKVSVNACLRGKQEVSAGYHWTYLKDKETQEKLKCFIGKPKSNQNGTGKSKKHPKIRCIETGEIFKNLKKASIAYPHCDIGACLRGKQKTAGKLTWEYCEE